MDINFILESIARQTDSELQKSKLLTCGLLSGDFGKIIYLYEYSKINPEYESIADDLLQKLFDTFRYTRPIPTYCGGLAGFGVGLQLLEKRGFVRGASEFLTDFDEYLSHILKGYLSASNLDFLHGATGVGFYFESRYDNDVAKDSINRYISYLEQSAIVCDIHARKCIKFKFDIEHDSKKLYNISLSHGISSVAILLSRIYKHCDDTALKNRIVILLDGIANYLLAQRINQFRYGSLFPIFPKECAPINKSRLAWCYGDLGISAALFHISSVTHDELAFPAATEVAEYAAINRLSPSKNAVYDAGICHGSSGVAQYFSKMHQLTANPIYSNAHDFWKNVTLNHCVLTDGKVNFPSFNASENTWENKTYILEGSAGCALMLMNSDNILNSILLYE